MTGITAGILGYFFHTKCATVLQDMYNERREIIGFKCTKCHREWRII